MAADRNLARPEGVAAGAGRRSQLDESAGLVDAVMGRFEPVAGQQITAVLSTQQDFPAGFQPRGPAHGQLHQVKIGQPAHAKPDRLTGHLVRIAGGSETVDPAGGHLGEKLHHGWTVQELLVRAGHPATFPRTHVR